MRPDVVASVRDHEARCGLAEAGARHGRLPARGRKADEHAVDNDNGAGEGNGPLHEATLESGEPGVEVIFRHEVAFSVADGPGDGLGLAALDSGRF